MMNSTWISLRIFITTTSLLLLIVSPAMAFASVHITKVLYDPPGADQGHEWIEISNTGDEPINLSSFKLAEGGTNHKITIVEGSSMLGAGTKAVVATDHAQYLADHPKFFGTLFKSSFSLSNTGETIQLKDAQLSVVDSYSYTAPIVVKEPTPVKQPKKVAVKPIAAVVTPYTPSNLGQTAALPLSQKQMPALPSSLVYSLGLMSLLVVGSAAALYARPTPTRMNQETSPSAEEFNIE